MLITEKNKDRIKNPSLIKLSIDYISCDFLINNNDKKGRPTGNKHHNDYHHHCHEFANTLIRLKATS